MPPRLSLTNVSKRYPAVLANDAVSLEVAAGEIHAVLGENGAGKSTLMKIVAGEVQPDSGEIAFDGRAVTIDGPQAARALGIAMVHQQFALFDTLTVAENVALGLPRSRSLADVQRDVDAAAACYGLAIDAQRRVHDLSIGERQRVEILRALLARPRLLILDEPTSVLAPQAVEALFATLRALAANGLAVVFISHKLDEVRQIADRCTIMRGGRVVATVDPKRESEASLARLMIGGQPPRIAAHDTPPGPPRLTVDGLRLDGGPSLAFTLHAGEILGVAGVSGNGQRALVSALAGETQVDADALSLDGRPLCGLNPRQRRALGLRYVPEERLRHGAVPELTLAENALLTGDTLRRRGFVLPGAMRDFARRVIERFDVRCPGPETVAARLSGGNLQKFIVGREIESAPRVLIAEQPTWGVDVGAATAIRNALIALRARGCAILVVSEELDELFQICDRIMVMARGRLSPAVPVRTVSIETIGRWMSGLWEADAAAGGTQ